MDSLDHRDYLQSNCFIIVLFSFYDCFFQFIRFSQLARFIYLFIWQQSAGYSKHILNHTLAKDFQADYVLCSFLTQFECWQHFENNVAEFTGLLSTGMERACAFLANGNVCNSLWD